MNTKNSMTIRQFAALLILTLPIFFGCRGEEMHQETPPNIILIMADDLGYGDLGVYGQEQIQTPNLDRMAGEGIRFLQHYSGSTVCAPSRSVLMTGLHSGHTPIRGNKEIFPIGQYPMPYGFYTLSGLLQEAGYATGGFGKWGLGYPGSEGMPSLHGFDRFFGYLGQRRAHFYYPEFLFSDVKGEELKRVNLEGNRVSDAPNHPGSGIPETAETYAPEVIHDEAIQFLNENSDRPFFLYYPSPIPHASLEVPEAYLEPYLDENGESIFDETPFPGAHYAPQSMPIATYAAMVSYLDARVGDLMNRIDSLGLSEKTLFIFTSDNGSHSEAGYHYSMLSSNGNLRGGKRDLYEGGIRVPMIMRWSGTIGEGRLTDHISGFQDLLPTLAGAAGIDLPVSVDGISMMPLLTETGKQPVHNYLYWEFHEQGGKQAIRKGDWKAVRLGVIEDPGAQPELYNLAKDPGEEANVASDYPDQISEMVRLMNDARVPSEIFKLFQNE
jgi:arylsulfatase A-like enzyme